jgi:hypothetical protein
VVTPSNAWQFGIPVYVGAVDQYLGASHECAVRTEDASPQPAQIPEDDPLPRRLAGLEREVGLRIAHSRNRHSDACLSGQQPLEDKLAVGIGDRLEPPIPVGTSRYPQLLEHCRMVGRHIVAEVHRHPRHQLALLILDDASDAGPGWLRR